MNRNKITSFLNNRRLISKLSMLSVFSFLLIMMSAVQASEFMLQENIIKGKITDAYTGNPIAGATIQVEGTETKVESNKDGTYSITLPGNSENLILTFPGYQTMNIRIDGRTEINFVISQEFEDPPLWYF